jgi:outer membrane protein OmpA-like peptidoglycan-associated protein
MDFVLEVYGTQLISEFGNTAYLSPEANGGFKVYVEGNSYLMAGFAAGLPISDTDSHYGFQNAQWRLFLGFAFEPSAGDRDGDGIKDWADKCPDNPEDMDGFQDSDGCPELDNDNDGIPDLDDDCPLVPEDADGDEDEDGCPEGQKDTDKDGILDENDKCPEQAEDRDRFEDKDGCPDLDNDGDGIPDTKDGCPDNPEDKDKFEDEDGCPDDDNDSDGIPDTADQCPNKKEVLNGIKDEDGCPDAGEELIVVDGAKIQLLKGIQFRTASDEIIGKKSFDILKAVVTVLKANPGLRVRIEGHTDARGGREYNIDLSQRRANSVMRYLVEKGISAIRLTPVGYGPDRPIETNKTAKGRAKNRRVEFIKLNR